MRRTTLTRSTAGGLVLCVLAAACGSADDAVADTVVLIDEPPVVSAPTTTTPPTTSAATTATTTIPPTTSVATTTLPTTSVATTTLPSSTSTTLGTSTTVASVAAEIDPTDTGATGPVASTGDDFGTIEPVFEVEPLQPFAMGTAASEPEVDDTGAAQPGGWLAFDAALADALLRNGNTAASVAVSIGGEIIHTAAFGLRAPIFGDDPAEPDDRFRIASISKPITAITLLQLVEDGTVGLDDPIGEIVAEHLGVTASSGAQQLTIRRLLGHTSGFGKYDAQFFGGASIDCADAARTGVSRGVGGSGYRYSNMNYCVAGVLVEALTGLDYEAAAYRHVLTPLQLSGMRLADTVDPGPGEIFHPYTPGRNYMETLGGAGGWIATPADLVAIMNTLDPSTSGLKLLDDDTLALMKTPAGGQLGQRGYGLGLIMYGGDRYGHTGTIENTRAMVQNRGDGVTWSITVSGPYPASTPRLESIINGAFVAAGFISA